MYRLEKVLENYKKSEDGVTSGDVGTNAFKPGPVDMNPTEKDLKKYIIAALQWLNNGENL